MSLSVVDSGWKHSKMSPSENWLSAQTALVTSSATSELRSHRSSSTISILVPIAQSLRSLSMRVHMMSACMCTS